jgi:hypothetical protein
MKSSIICAFYHSDFFARMAGKIFFASLCLSHFTDHPRVLRIDLFFLIILIFNITVCYIFFISQF